VVLQEEPRELEPLSEERHRVLRSTMGIFLASQVVVVIVLASLRFLIARETVVGVNQTLGILSAVLALVSGYLGTRARAAVAAGDALGCHRLLGWALGIGALAAAVMFVQWIAFHVPPGSHYGEIFFVTTGGWLLYELAALFVVLAARYRGLRVVYTPQNHWDVEAATLFLSWASLLAPVTYILLYLI
jgi:cytochrome c oxidase subunit 3